MDIAILFVLVMATYRTSQIVAQESIFEPVRAWIVKGGLPPEQLSGLRKWAGLLIHCAGCVSVWVGWLYAGLMCAMSIIGPEWIFLYGLAASGGAVALGEFIGAIGAKK